MPNNYSYTTVLHALVDLVQAVEKQGMVGPATPAYKAALEVIRGRVAPGGEQSHGPNGEVVDYVRRMKKSAEEGELYGFADDCDRLLALLGQPKHTATSRPSE